MRLVPHLTVYAVLSGGRKDVYVTRESAPQEAAFRAMREDPFFRERELTFLAAAHAAGGYEIRQNLSVVPHGARAAKNAVLRAGLALGIPPNALRNVLRLQPKGNTIDVLRKMRGLPPAARDR